jgi:hypothetical protein
VAVLPPELLKQPVSLQQAAALAESTRIRGLLRGRWVLQLLNCICCALHAL